MPDTQPGSAARCGQGGLLPPYCRLPRGHDGPHDNTQPGNAALCERIGCNEPGTILIHAPMTQNDSVACEQHVAQMLAIGWQRTSLPPYDHEAAMRLLDALNDPDWEAKRMAQEPTATSRPGRYLRLLWWLDNRTPRLADRLWALRSRRQARKMPGPF